MKYTNLKRFCTGLALFALVACICVPVGAAAQQYVVNNGQQLSGTLEALSGQQLRALPPKTFHNFTKAFM